MKKKILFSICFFLTCILSSCSNEDLLQNTGVSSLDKSSVVYFSCCSNGQKGMTRSGATVTSLTTFNVWSSTADGNAYIGALNGSGEAFTYDALSEVFKSDVNHYWPSVGTLNFFASNVFTQMDEYHSDQTPHDAVASYTNDGSKDIVCATVRTGTKTIPYPLLFHHVLSQVKVTAEAKDKTQDLQYRVVGITMTTQDDGLYHYATSTGGIGTWELNDDSSTRAYAFGANMPAVFEKDGRFASTDYWNVLPCVNDIVFSIQYQVIQNGVVISDFTGANAKTVTVSSPGLLSEKKYTYNFKLGIDNDDVITFTQTISAWEDGTTTDIDVPFALTKDKLISIIDRTVGNDFPTLFNTTGDIATINEVYVESLSPFLSSARHLSPMVYINVNAAGFVSEEILANFTAKITNCRSYTGTTTIGGDALTNTASPKEYSLTLDYDAQGVYTVGSGYHFANYPTIIIGSEDYFQFDMNLYWKGTKIGTAHFVYEDN